MQGKFESDKEKIRIRKSILPPSAKYFDHLSNRMTVFQSYRSFKDYWIPSLINGIRTRTIPLFIYLFDGETCNMILPLMYSKKKCTFYGSSAAGGMARLSPIYYQSITVEKRNKYLKEVLDCINSRSFMFSRMTDDIASAFICASNMKAIETGYDECVSIFYSRFSCYEDYFHSLSKSVRQNIRTALNRLNQDNHRYSLQKYSEKTIDDDLRKRLINIFLDRHEERYGIKHTKILSLYYNYFDYVVRSVKHNDNICTTVFFIDDKPAAFFIGFHDKSSKTMYVPRLAINSEYGKYSPGMLLVSEAIKDSFKDNDLRTLDLLLGEEKYKYDLGGEKYRRNIVKLSKN